MSAPQPDLGPMPSGLGVDVPAFKDADPVIRALSATNLLGVGSAETDVRGLLDNVAADPMAPTARDLSIAILAALMAMGGTGWPVILKVLAALKARNPAHLRGDAVAIVNGSHIIMPGKGKDDVVVYQIATLRVVTEMPEGIVSTIYSVTAIWDRIEPALKG